MDGRVVLRRGQAATQPRFDSRTSLGRSPLTCVRIDRAQELTASCNAVGIWDLLICRDPSCRCLLLTSYRKCMRFAVITLVGLAFIVSWLPFLGRPSGLHESLAVTQWGRTNSDIAHSIPLFSPFNLRHSKDRFVNRKSHCRPTLRLLDTQAYPYQVANTSTFDNTLRQLPRTFSLRIYGTSRNRTQRDATKSFLASTF